VRAYSVNVQGTSKRGKNISHASPLCLVVHFQPRPQGPLLVQSGGRRNPWPRLLKYSKNHRVFCHVTHDEMAFSEVVSSVWQPYLFFCNLKPLFKQNEDISSCFTWQNPHEFLEPFSSLGQGFLRPLFWMKRRPWGRGWCTSLFLRRFDIICALSEYTPTAKWTLFF